MTNHHFEHACGSCKYYEPCAEEGCETEKPHGLCYVHPPRLTRSTVDDDGSQEHESQRGVPTWASAPVCHFYYGEG